MLNVKKWLRQVFKREAEPIFHCFHCGVCCTRYQVKLSQAEAWNIADHLGLTWELLLDKYMDPRWPGTKSYLVRKQQGACVLLRHPAGSNMSSCLVHSYKPLSCLEWIPSLHRSECREGLAKYWGLNVNSLGKLQGTEEKIRNFQAFQKSLSS